MEVTLPARGEAPAEKVGLCLSLNAMIKLEEIMGISFLGDGFAAEKELEGWMRSGGLKNIRTMTQVALNGWRTKFAPAREEFTEEEAGELFDQLGGDLEECTITLMKLYFTSSKRGSVDQAVAAVGEGEAPAAGPGESEDSANPS